jgi:cytochrome c nitrite reductase small subunit
MAPQYATWAHSAHKNSVCNDCHVPQDNFFKKYFFKANDGLRHATLFTLRLEPQTIFIKEAGSEAVQDNCLRCHEHTFAGIERLTENIESKKNHSDRKCIECHRETPHGRVNSLSAVPYARVPLLKSPVPQWMDKFLKNN